MIKILKIDLFNKVDDFVIFSFSIHPLRRPSTLTTTAAMPTF